MTCEGETAGFNELKTPLTTFFSSKDAREQLSDSA